MWKILLINVRSEKEYKFAYLFHYSNDFKIDIKKQHKRDTQITVIGVFYAFYSFFFPKESLWKQKFFPLSLF